MTVDYKATVFLPQTDFPMKAGLPKLEPELLARWVKLDLYKKLRADAKGRPPFVLHDGPPYANGNIHIGTAMNKILKDIVVRTRQMTGQDANYVPGWDCHGLPIEWKIEEQYRAAGRDKDAVPKVEFRKECRDFANYWIDVQRAEFKRLGVTGDWDHPYLTMDYAAEAAIVDECLKFLMNGGLFRGSKPVMWSVVEKTALAEAEVEYHEHTSSTLFVKFPVVQGPASAAGASIVIWTTTPWTLPANRAIALKADADYVRVRVTALAEKAQGKVGDEVLVAAELLPQVLKACLIEGHEVVATLKGSDLTGAVCAHPLRGQGYDFDVPVLAGDFVTMDTGTGFVHIAPGHGKDDFDLWTATFGQDGIPFLVAPDGSYYDNVPLFAGKRILTAEGKDGDANGAVIGAMAAAGALLGKGRLRHQYPHSWRSKAPLIFRNTPQWFISMETNDLRKTALAAIEATRFVPASGQNRLRGMIQDRPDWVISRQRAWGVPISVFVNKATGECLRDPAVNQRIVDAVKAEGADAWFASPPERFLGSQYKADDYEQVADILDVWFDSGSTHAFVLEQRPDLRWPASLYLEGSDQHRGWFHSSLLEACGTRGRAPYDAVLTHGFVMAGDGQKMSKSLGNVVAPQSVMDQNGADILRLWVVSTDFTEDLKISGDIIKAQVDAYRRIRNTMRWLLGNLAGFSAAEKVDVKDMPPLERFVLHRLAELDKAVRDAVEAFDFHRLFVSVYTFCSVDLSAFYFDIRKDALYCDATGSTRRRAARTVLDQVFNCLTAWLAPILVFSAEEAWLARFPSEDGSVHLRQFPEIPAAWRDEALAKRWDKVRDLRRVVTGALEIERAQKRIGTSLQAHPVLHAPAADLAALDGLDFAEICITSGVTLSADPAPAGAFSLADVGGAAVIPGMALGNKCQRCWQVLVEVGQDAAHPDLCRRCTAAVAA